MASIRSKEIVAEVYILDTQSPHGKTAKELALGCQRKVEIKLKEALNKSQGDFLDDGIASLIEWLYRPPLE